MYVGLSILSAFITVVLTLNVPILIGNAVDLLIDKDGIDINAMIAILVKVCISVGITACAQWFMNMCNNKTAYYVVRDIRNEAMEKIETLPLKYIDGKSHGELVSRVIADADQFLEGLLMGFTQFFTGVLTIIGTLVLMLGKDVMITLVVLLITPISLFVAAFIARKTFSTFKSLSEARGEQTALINEMIGNQKVVKAYSYEKEAVEKFDEINSELSMYSLKGIFISSISNPATRFINGLVYVGVGLTSALSVIHGHITIGELTCLLSYANQYTKPFNEISGVVTELQNALACVGRIFELIEEESQTPDTNDAVILPLVDGRVSLKKVHFSYEPEVKLIENFNLLVKPGQKIAIVGPTGCGKTTIINLLMRFYDVDKGSIEVEGIDIKEIKRNSLRSSYGMVLQETWLRRGSIKDNICIGKPDATLEEVVSAAKASHAHSFIKRLPNGYETMINEEGEGLSAGQKQLLCIARIMLSLPPMLILDEATSSIDTRTEIKIQEAFSKMMKGRTSFIVAHRLSTIMEADVILVMNNGNVIEQGNHVELLKKNGFYARLYKSQFVQE